MHKQSEAEIHILDRVLYMLEERSVAWAAEHNESFRGFVEDLYSRVETRATGSRTAA